MHSSYIPVQNNTSHLPPSLEEYAAFHGMLCGPNTAHRCIDSFEQGAIMFVDQRDCDTKTPSAEESSTDYNFILIPFNELPIPLNVWTYYLMVVATFTGFCSLMGWTRLIKAVDYTNQGNSVGEKSNCDRISVSPSPRAHEAKKKIAPSSSFDTDFLWQFKIGDDKWFESSYSLSCSSSASTIQNKEANRPPLRVPPEAMEYVINRSVALGPLRQTQIERTDATKRTFNTDYDNGSPKSVRKHDNKGTKRIRTPSKSLQAISEDNSTRIKSKADATNPEITLMRHFEYDFGGYISVMMLHFACTNGMTHLVEVFHLHEGTIPGILVHRFYKFARSTLKARTDIQDEEKKRILSS